MPDAAPQTQTDPRDAVAEPDGVRPAGGDELVERDLLVEDVSIDGMCGVY